MIDYRKFAVAELPWQLNFQERNFCVLYRYFSSYTPAVVYLTCLLNYIILM